MNLNMHTHSHRCTRTRKKAILAKAAQHVVRGLTLLEVLVALAVLGILATVALPAMSGMQQRHQLVAAAETLAADLSEARFEAARSGQVLHVQSGAASHAGGPWCWAVSTQANCACGRQQDQAGAQPGCLLKQVQSVDYPGISLLGPVHVRLQPQGGAGAMTYAELQSRQGDRLRVEVAALGRSRICVPSGRDAMPTSRYSAC